MTLLSEFGDRTFCVAAILAMRYPRRSVLLGCLSSVIVTTILSALVGWAAPNLISPKLGHHITTLLFFGFGLWSLWEAYCEDDDDNEELEQVEKELDAGSKMNAGQAKMSEKILGGAEALSQGSFKKMTLKKPGLSIGSPYLYPKGKVLIVSVQDDEDLKKQQQPLLAHFFSPVFIKAFSVTFFGEWGDKSQLATIGLAADEDAVGVILGGIIAQVICTVIAVIGGKNLASRISERLVTLLSGLLFLVFGVLSFHSSSN